MRPSICSSALLNEVSDNPSRADVSVEFCPAVLIASKTAAIDDLLLLVILEV